MGAWGEAEYDLRSDIADALGFSLERDSGHVIRVLERYQGVELTSAAGVAMRVGVAVRLTVRLNQPQSEMSLSKLAAVAENGGGRAAGIVSVLGFAHPAVAGVISGEFDLDVDGYARLIAAVEEIQRLVAANPGSVVPAVIARFEPSNDFASWHGDWIIGATWGLARLADRIAFKDCASLLTDDLIANQQFKEGVRHTYSVVMGAASNDAPTVIDAQDAENRLHAIRVSGPLRPPHPSVVRSAS
jgi:hypothetical protein